jgi:thymidylate synthase ThyX
LSNSACAESPILALNHSVAHLSSGGMVLLLNTGAVITAEDEAMLQALHSRNPNGVLEHLKKLARTGSGRFMESFYIGYGHKSVGDGGTITLFIEGVSMLCAKAIQDWLLYSGQECSTRYLDFSKQPFVDPFQTAATQQYLRDLRQLYISSLEPTKASLRRRFPMAEGEDQAKYEKAINARAFDILRSLLPAGAMTNLTWHGNLRQTADKLLWLRHHPLPEVQEVAAAMEKACRQANPNSFSGKRYEATEGYIEQFMKERYYFDRPVQPFMLVHNGIDLDFLKGQRKILARRPAKAELPKSIGQAGTLRYEMLLDFGSFRDIQRQRSLNQRMPCLTTEYGFHSWYLSEMPEEVRTSVEHMLSRLQKTLAETRAPSVLRQYLIPMGYQVPNEFSGDIPSLVYVAELRAKPDVHPTLQDRAHQLADSLLSLFGEECGLVLHVEKGAQGRFDVRRGSQDIVERVVIS